MPSERIQLQINKLLDEIEVARSDGDWRSVRDKAEEILDLDPENQDAGAFLRAAERRDQRQAASQASPSSPPPGSSEAAESHQPTSFAGGRYEVRRFLGEAARRKATLPTTPCSTATSPSP